MIIDDIKNHGAVLGLEVELKVRLNTMRNAETERNWTLIYSCAAFIQQLADELIKLEDKLKK